MTTLCDRACFFCGTDTPADPLPDFKDEELIKKANGFLYGANSLIATDAYGATIASMAWRDHNQTVGAIVCARCLPNVENVGSHFRIRKRIAQFLTGIEAQVCKLCGLSSFLGQPYPRLSILPIDNQAYYASSCEFRVVYPDGKVIIMSDEDANKCYGENVCPSCYPLDSRNVYNGVMIRNRLLGGDVHCLVSGGNSEPGSRIYPVAPMHYYYGRKRCDCEECMLERPPHRRTKRSYPAGYDPYTGLQLKGADGKPIPANHPLVSFNATFSDEKQLQGPTATIRNVTGLISQQYRAEFKDVWPDTGVWKPRLGPPIINQRFLIKR